MAQNYSPYGIDEAGWTPLAAVVAEADAQERRLTRRAGVLLALVAAAVAAVVLSGVWTPRLAFAGAGFGWPVPPTRTASVELQVRNAGLMPVVVEGPARVSVPGLEATAATRGAIAPLASGTLDLELRAVDCGLVLAQPAGGDDDALTVTARTWRGDVPVDLALVPSTVTSLAQALCGRP